MLRLYQCTLCGRCGSACHVDLDLPAIWEELREWLVREGREIPEAHRRTAAAILKEKDLQGLPAKRRPEWSAGLSIPESADTVFFAGCLYSHDLLNLPRRVLEILGKAGASVTTLGADEWCCGNPLLHAGQTRTFAELAGHNVTAVLARKASRLVTACPGCYRVLKLVYPRRGVKVPFEVLHLSELLAELMDGGKLRPRKAVEGKWIYHDPCELGRRGGVYDAPRKVLEGLPGLKLLEFPDRRGDSACCGAGGGLKALDGALSLRIARERLSLAREAGASGVVSACPGCRINFTEAELQAPSAGGTGRRPALEVRDILELVSRSL